MKLIPEAEELYIIYDYTTSGSADYYTVSQYGKNTDSVRVVFIPLGSMTFDELYVWLDKLGRNQPVILLSAFRDIQNTTLSFSQTVERIIGHSGAPVFHLWSHGIGDGLAGGYVVDHEFHAELSAQIVEDLLRGASIENYPVTPVSKNRYLFDKEVMEKFDLDLRDLPGDAVLINKNPLLNKKTLGLFIVLLFIILVLSTMIILILRYQRLLQRTEKRYRGLFHENAGSHYHQRSRQADKLLPVMPRQRKLTACPVTRVSRI